MADDDHSAITVSQAKLLFADWKTAPAIALAVSGGRARGALPPAGAGRKGQWCDAYPHRAYPRRPGRDVVDADAARQRHCRAGGDGAPERTRRRLAGAAAAGCSEIATGRDAAQG